MLANIQYPTYEALEVALRSQSHIHSIESQLFWIAIPLALLPPIPLTWKQIWIRTLFITLLVWITLMNFRIVYEIPWNRIVMDIEKRNPEYDGVGGNVALLVLGWIFPFLQCLATLCVTRFFLTRYGPSRKPNSEPVSP